MKKKFAALALAIAIPAAAHAQAAPTPVPEKKMECCCEKMGKKMDCCEEHGRRAGQDEHAGHDMSQHQQHQQPNP